MQSNFCNWRLVEVAETDVRKSESFMEDATGRPELPGNRNFLIVYKVTKAM